jgi:hypothetical protein
MDPQKDLLHPKVWFVPTWASALALHLHVLNLHLNYLTVHLNAMNLMTPFWNSYLKWSLNVQTHHLELVEGQEYLHAAPMENERDFPQIEHCAQ